MAVQLKAASRVEGKTGRIERLAKRHARFKAVFSKGSIVAHDWLEKWMRTLVGYVRSGDPDLTNRQMAILLLVGQTQGPHTVRGLASRLTVSKPVVTRALNKLATLGFLRRQRDEADKRNIFVSVTERGGRFLERFQSLIERSQPETSPRAPALTGRAASSNGPRTPSYERRTA